MSSFCYCFSSKQNTWRRKYNQHENSIAQNEIKNTKKMAFCIHFSTIWQGCTVMKILPISTLTRILCWETNINHQSLLMSDSAMEVVYPKQIFLFHYQSVIHVYILFTCCLFVEEFQEWHLAVSGIKRKKAEWNT